MQVFGDVLNSEEAARLCQRASIIVLGVKPRHLAAVLGALAPHIEPQRHRVVSIAAGWTLSRLQRALPASTPVWRIMPNTPVQVCEGATAWCAGDAVPADDRHVIPTLLAGCGVAVEVEEALLDGVVGVAGSAPAYFFQVLDAMSDGGVAVGLPRATALRLAAQTMKGAAEMVLSSTSDGSLAHPGVLKDQVTSPGGTTIEAVTVLEEEGVRAAFIAAVIAAAEKSSDMAATD